LWNAIFLVKSHLAMFLPCNPEKKMLVTRDMAAAQLALKTCPSVLRKETSQKC
jgi:hypothetical protein